jgi:spore cortex formation protein SpoVR/YcgB (stage V sporulation)
MKDTTYDRLIANLKLLDPRITKAGLRLGLDPYVTDYYLVTDAQMAQNLVYVAMPVHYSHWRYGKQAQSTRPGHVFEVVINSDPSFCYLGTTNDLRMQALVIAHAKWGHVDFFKNNFLYKTTGAKDCIQRFEPTPTSSSRSMSIPTGGARELSSIWTRLTPSSITSAGCPCCPARKIVTKTLCAKA